MQFLENFVIFRDIKSFEWPEVPELGHFWWFRTRFWLFFERKLAFNTFDLIFEVNKHRKNNFQNLKLSHFWPLLKTFSANQSEFSIRFAGNSGFSTEAPMSTSLLLIFIPFIWRRGDKRFQLKFCEPFSMISVVLIGIYCSICHFEWRLLVILIQFYGFK